jgi:hypothetical protein
MAGSAHSQLTSRLQRVFVPCEIDASTDPPHGNPDYRSAKRHGSVSQLSHLAASAEGTDLDW